MIAVAYSNGIAPVNLSRRHEIRKRLDQMALDGPFQVASAIPHIGALLQQEILGFFREIPAGSLDAGACDPGAELRFRTGVFTRGVMKSQPRFNESTHLGGAEIAGHENYRARKVHSAIIAQRQSGLVLDPQE